MFYVPQNSSLGQIISTKEKRDEENRCFRTLLKNTSLPFVDEIQNVLEMGTIALIIALYTGGFSIIPYHISPPLLLPFCFCFVLFYFCLSALCCEWVLIMEACFFILVIFGIFSVRRYHIAGDLKIFIWTPKKSDN